VQLSQHFTLAEMTVSSTANRLGIDNALQETDLIVDNLRFLCQELLEPLRSLVKVPVKILSGYRCEKLNEAVGGSKNSQHMLGEAADIHVLNFTNKELFDLIQEKLNFDQLILEKVDPKILGSGWVHVSYKKKQNRHKAFEIKK